MATSDPVAVTITVSPIACPVTVASPLADPGRCRTGEQWQHARQISRANPWGASTPARQRDVERRLLDAAAAGPDACHIWSGRVNVSGYSVITGPGRPLVASRVVWSRDNGPIPPDHEIDHTCGNPLCVNINHLECVTIAENRRRRGERMRSGTPSQVDEAARARQRKSQQAYRDRATAKRTPEEWAQRDQGRRDRMAHASKVRLDRLRRRREEGEQPQPTA